MAGREPVGGRRLARTRALTARAPHRGLLIAGLATATWLAGVAVVDGDADGDIETAATPVPSMSRNAVPEPTPHPLVYWEPARLPDARR